jgi:Domain of unknown function (DUF4159)
VPRLFARRPLVLIVTALVAFVLAVRVEAQFRQRRGGGGFRGFGNISLAKPSDFDGSWHFCRAWFRQDPRGDGGNWSVDYPRADINLSVRLSELTKTNVSFTNGEPNPLLIRFTDDELFDCPFVMMTEVGSAFIDNDEAARMREYMLKGGFIWADDFWGSYAWEWWTGQLSKVFPPNEYPIIDLPSTHPLFQAQFVIKKVPQIASINFWAGSGGGTSERGEDSAEPHARAILDRHGNIMMLMTHNTDLGDSFEREGDDPQYFYLMSVPGYAFGINALLYGLTH